MKFNHILQHTVFERCLFFQTFAEDGCIRQSEVGYSRHFFFFFFFVALQTEVQKVARVKDEWFVNLEGDKL